MIEKEHIAMPDNLPDETKPKIRPVLFKIGFIFALLGLVTPFLVYLATFMIIQTPPNGEDHTPGDGLMMIVVAIFGIIWWTFAATLGFASMLVGFIRKETGRIKIFAIAASALSLILIISVYVGAYAFVEYEKQQTKRYRPNQHL